MLSTVCVVTPLIHVPNLIPPSPPPHLVQRARKLRKKMAAHSKAVTVISAAFRGYSQRKRFKQMKKELEAAIRIQAFYRYL